MSRAYDARQTTIEVYPNPSDSGVDLFIQILGCSEEDFEFENGESVTKYLWPHPTLVENKDQIIARLTEELAEIKWRMGGLEK